MSRFLGWAIFLLIVVGGLWIVSRVMLAKAISQGAYIPSQDQIHKMGVREIRAPFGEAPKP